MFSKRDLCTVSNASFSSQQGLQWVTCKNTVILSQVIEGGGIICCWRSSVQRCQDRAFSWWSDLKPRGSWAVLTKMKSGIKSAVLQRSNVCRSISWNMKQTLCLTGILSSYWSVSLRKAPMPAFFYTLLALTNTRAKTTANYMKKATAVTADSTMVDSSTWNPVFWGLIQCARVCFWALCGLACLKYVSSVFGCFEQMLRKEISETSF